MYNLNDLISFPPLICMGCAWLPLEMMEKKRIILCCEIVNTLTALLNCVERYLLYWATSPAYSFPHWLALNLQADFRLAVCSYLYACLYGPS